MSDEIAKLTKLKRPELVDLCEKLSIRAGRKKKSELAKEIVAVRQAQRERSALNVADAVSPVKQSQTNVFQGQRASHAVASPPRVVSPVALPPRRIDAPPPSSESRRGRFGPSDAEMCTRASVQRSCERVM